MHFHRLRFGELWVDRLTFAEALLAIAALVARKLGGQVFTPNVDHVVLAASNPAFRDAYRAADLSLVDGMPVLWGSRLLGLPLPEKISGSDLLLPLVDQAARHRWRVFLLGGAPGVAEAVSDQLRKRFPTLQVVGTASPKVDVSPDGPLPLETIERINRLGTDLLLVALGSPKQEIFIHRVAPYIRRTVSVGVGAGFDFLTGRAKRAPGWISRLGFEWLFRLCREPRRLWRRYLVRDPIFFLILARALLTPRRRLVELPAYEEARLVPVRSATRSKPRVDPTRVIERGAAAVRQVTRQVTPAVENAAFGLRVRSRLFFDLAIVLLSLGAAYVVSGRALFPLTQEPLWLGASLSTLWIFACIVLRHYDFSRKRAPTDDAAMVTVLVAALGSVVALGNITGDGRAMIPSAWSFISIFWPLAVAARLAMHRSIYRLDHEPPVEEVLILGTNPLGRLTAESLMRKPGVKVMGFLSLPTEQATGMPAPVLGTNDELERLLHDHAVTEVYLAGNQLKQGELLQAAVQSCEKFGVRFALPACGFRLDRARAASASPDSYLHYTCIEPKSVQLAIKRLTDILVSAVALALLSPLLLLTAVAIKLTSRGPVFFRQVRSGLYGRHFNMLKFRSMVSNAERLQAGIMSLNEQRGPVFKIRHDPRVTPMGKFLRKYSIDELPQLLNVLRGDMSLVGPRPPVPSEVVQYLPWQRRRLSMRPGLTCIWQVSGRNNLSFDQWMYLDMRYIDNWSLAEDFNLLLRTVPVVLTGDGAS
jgi:exopolysaccharide biosynthesis polyprenyl glycosylphosphotransferase